MKKDFNRIIYYFMGIIILTVYSLEGTNLHSDFTTTLVSYIILISVLSQFYEWGYGKKKYKNCLLYTSDAADDFIYNVFFTQ